MKPVYSIFYSWQSDLSRETNQAAIRQAIRDACTQVENEIEDIRIDIDEATRGTTGSPNIPQTIFDKISTNDIFICDLTTINKNAPGAFKRTPNPNVLIELGFAVATLGWNRIIMVFNTVHGTFPTDMPFDIDRHRAISFTINDKKDGNGKNQLSKVLKVAIQDIIEKSPIKPDEKRKETPEQKKRSIDVSNLREALNTIHIPAFDYFLETMPDMIMKEIFYFRDSFVYIAESSLFHIYDMELSSRLTKFKTTWTKSLSFYQHYEPDTSGRCYRFYLVMDVFQSEEAERDYKIISQLCFELERDFRELLQFVRYNYLEINLEETSKNALEKYNKFLTGEG